MSSKSEFNQAMNSVLDVLHLHPDGVDMIIDTVIEVLSAISAKSDYQIEALAMVKRRAEAIREAVKNNPLPELPDPCKQPVH
jgi:hypothetical protein|nr:MAG TPA: hypothetical protein [Bacteriophage sp.]